MIKKIKYGLVAWLIVIATNLYGQNGFLSANHSYQMKGIEFTLFSETSFSIGYASTCPSLDTVTVSKINSIIVIDLFFDLRGAWPQAGCTTYDTSSVKIDTNFNSIIVNIKTIEYGDSINDSVIYNVQTDTLVEKPLSLFEKHLENNIIIYPNPTISQLNISNPAGIDIVRIKVYDFTGRVVMDKEFSEQISTADLISGSYILELNDEDNNSYTAQFIKI